MSEHLHQDELEERDDVVDTEDGGEAEAEPTDGEPWAKTSSGDADDIAPG